MQAGAVKKIKNTVLFLEKPAQSYTKTVNSGTETGLYYYGARYLDPKTSRWISADPAMGEYVPSPGQRPDKLPGMGGVYNIINFHCFAYAGNNPIRLTDPDGRDIEGYIKHDQEFKQKREQQRLERLEKIKNGEIGTFTQNQWTVDLDFKESFAGSACAATAYLNTVARAYALENDMEMTVEMGAGCLRSAINEGLINKYTANIDGLIADTITHMAERAGIRGTLEYVDEGTNAMWKVYSLHRGYYPDKSQKCHFVNASTEGKYYDPYNGSIKNLADDTLSPKRGIRGINYNPPPLKNYRYYK